MGINQGNLESILRRFEALDQRREPIRQVMQVLASGVIFRTPQGGLSIPPTTEDKEKMKAWLKAYTDELQGIIDSIRAEIK